MTDFITSNIFTYLIWGHIQYSQNVDVWAGILGNTIIGTLFIDGELTGELYWNLLEEIKESVITSSLENLIDATGKENVTKARFLERNKQQNRNKPKIS